MSKRLWLFAFVSTALLFLSACAPIVRSEQAAHPDFLGINQEDTVGQTFVSQYRGLEGITLYLEPANDMEGTISVDLREDPASKVSLASSKISLSNITQPGYYNFLFSEQNKSNWTSYFFLIQLEGSGSVNIGAAGGETYLDGALYLNSESQDKQLDFKLLYDPFSTALGLLIEAINWLKWIFITSLLFVLPGWALLWYCLPSWERLDWIERVAASIGVSLAIYPVLMVWTDAFNLHIGILNAWLPVLLGALFLLIKIYRQARVSRDKKLEPNSQNSYLAGFSSSKSASTLLPWFNIFVILLLSLVFVIRFWVIRKLDAPMWGDSVQHATIAQLILDHGGLFSSWLPYAPYKTLSVQFGFSVIVACFSWLTHLDIKTATLVAGQILNGLAILSLYPLAKYLARGNAWAGAGAILVAGLLSPMPAFYVNWGRYAQLAGQAILPVAIWLLCLLLEYPFSLKSKSLVNEETSKLDNLSGFQSSRQRYWVNMVRLLVLAGLVIAGMTFSYYRMPIFLAMFFLAWFIGRGWTLWGRNWIGWISGWGCLLFAGIISGLFFAPWIPRLVGSRLAGYVEAGIAGNSATQGLLSDFQTWRYIDQFIPVYLLVLALIGLIWSLRRKAWLVTVIPLWFLFLSAYKGGQIIRLPAANLLEVFAIQIALYIPAALIIAWLIGDVITNVQRLRQKFLVLATGAILLAAALWGTINQRSLTQPETYAFVTRPDLKAFDWITEHLSTDSRVLVEGFRIYQGKSAVGSDAGWWVPVSTRTQNTMPPQYALLNETPIIPGYSRSIVDLVAFLEENPAGSPESIQVYCKEKITHIYIGQRQGSVGFNASPLFSPQAFEANPAFNLVYRQDRVYLYELNPALCASSN